MDLATKLMRFVAHGGTFAVRTGNGEYLATASVPPRDWNSTGPGVELTFGFVIDDSGENSLESTLSRLIDTITCVHPAFEDCGFAPPTMAEITGE